MNRQAFFRAKLTSKDRGGRHESLHRENQPIPRTCWQPTTGVI